MAEKLTIANWAEEDKPREKLERLGASALSNAELLGILIGSGSTDESAVDLMKRILKDCDNNLNQLGKKTIRELTQYKGMGPAKAITILAACELGKRRALDKIGTRPDLGSSLAIYNYMLPKMQDLDTEEAWLLMMNQNFKIIKASCISKGGITETATDIRLIIKKRCSTTLLLSPSATIIPATILSQAKPMMYLPRRLPKPAKSCVSSLWTMSS